MSPAPGSAGEMGRAEIEQAGVERADIEQAGAAIAGRVRRTPVIEVDVPCVDGVLRGVALKLECLQHAGSFKPRGAFWSVLSAPERPECLVAASGGNHGLAVAHVGAALGIPTKIFVPTIAAPVKVAAIRALGAEVVQVGAVYAEALAASQDAAGAPGALALHAYDAPATIAGQGTVGLEILHQVPDVDTILVAVGGGGLVAGVRAACDEAVRVIAVETERCATYATALTAGREQAITPSGVAADALGASTVGALARGILARHGVPSVVVGDADTMATRRWLWEALRVVVEPSGAVALTALRTGAYRPEAGERVAVVLCGANTDPADLTAGPDGPAGR